MFCLTSTSIILLIATEKDFRRIEITADYSASYAFANAFVLRRID